MRNVLIACGNSGEPGLVEAVEPHLSDSSPLVRGAAVWALSELMDQDRFSVLQMRHAAQESDADVLTEWRIAVKNHS